MAQLNDLLVMGQSTLLGPVKIDSIIDKNGSNGATNSSTIDKVLKSDDNGKIYWGSADNVTFSQTLTSGTKIGTITINGTGTDLYCQTNTNTTYTFANGTNGFTVTPAGGNAQTVTVTPSITNNITGSGTRTNGYIAKFSGTNTITNGPAIGTSTTTYLRNDGQWATPPGTTYSNFVKSGTGAKAGLVPAPSTTAGTTKYLCENGTWATPTDNNTTYTFGNGTNGFTVKPSNSNTTQTVTITPSITNNITGTGTSGYLAKFNGTNTITSGPQLGTSTTTYLRNDGTWATPAGTYSLPLAANGTRGGIKIGYVASNANIPVQLSSEKAYVALTSSAITSALGYPLSASGNRWGVLTYVDNDGDLCIGDSIRFYTSDTTTTTTGTITAGATYISSSKEFRAPSFYATSDARLKTNIKSYEFTKKSILDLPIYKFDFIQGRANQIGCLAQDLQKICPEIVAVDENGFLSIQESKIAYLLINEIKKLKNRIDMLEEQRRVD